MKKVTFNASDELVERIDNFGARLGINRSSTVCVLVDQALQAVQVVDAMEANNKKKEENEKKKK